LNDGRDGCIVRYGKAFRPKDANGKNAGAEVGFTIAWSWSYGTSGRGIIAVGGKGRLFALSKFPGHDERERMCGIGYSGRRQ